MEKSKHTPGPWEIQPTVKGTAMINAPTMGPGHYHVAEVFGDNARLISAAPELLAALEEMVQDSECYCITGTGEPNKGPCGYCKARAAIAKAKGE